MAAVHDVMSYMSCDTSELSLLRCLHNACALISQPGLAYAAAVLKCTAEPAVIHRLHRSSPSEPTQQNKTLPGYRVSRTTKALPAAISKTANAVLLYVTLCQALEQMLFPLEPGTSQAWTKTTPNGTLSRSTLVDCRKLLQKLLPLQA